MDAATWCYQTFSTGVGDGWYPKGKFPDPTKCVVSTTKPVGKPKTTHTSTQTPHHHGISPSGQAALGFGGGILIMALIFVGMLLIGPPSKHIDLNTGKRLRKK